MKLSDATRVSTEEAARHAAKERTKGEKKSETKSDDGADKADAGNSPSSKVSELQPSLKAKDVKSSAGNESESGERKPSKIHGSVYGATGAGSRSSNAEAGASSKSGKTHVYVETGRTENKDRQ